MVNYNCSADLAPIVAWEWDFNDDAVIDSYDQSATWVYEFADSFTVSLTVHDSFGGTSTTVKENYITTYTDSNYYSYLSKYWIISD